VVRFSPQPMRRNNEPAIGKYFNQLARRRPLAVLTGIQLVNWQVFLEHWMNYSTPAVLTFMARYYARKPEPSNIRRGRTRIASGRSGYQLWLAKPHARPLKAAHRRIAKDDG
jgi:hypothetical protein